MRPSSILTRHGFHGAALAVALMLAGGGTITAHGAQLIDPASTVAHIHPADRAIALIESLDPANARVTFVVMPPASTPGAPKAYPEPLNICIRCDDLA